MPTATPHPVGSAHPYASVRLPVFGREVVATSHPLAAQAGLQVMREGGNAVDAAVAAAAVMTVVEPVSNGLGGDAFAQVWDGERLHGLDACGAAPAAWTPAYFQNRYGDGAVAPPQRGVDSITVPGMVSGWVALHQRFGRRPFEALLAPAIEVAERGHAVAAVVRHKWLAGAPELRDQPGFAQAFLPYGRVPRVGERWAWPAAAQGLRAIARSSGEAFYRGEVAHAMARFVAHHGGALSLADLAAHAPRWVEPVAHPYRGHALHELPPSGQGLAALMALGMLAHWDVAQGPADGPYTHHLQIEAMKLAFADVLRHVADPAAMHIGVQELLDPDYLARRARLIDPQRAQAPVTGCARDVHRRGGTIYLTTADASGLMVSWIQSNYMGFGSGCVEPTFGISLHNRGHGFGLPAGGLNPANEVAPGKRPFHTIIPAFLSRPAGAVGAQAATAVPAAHPTGVTPTADASATAPPALEPVMAFGVMGANMQPQGHVQTLVRVLDQGQSLQAACDAPRWRIHNGLSLSVEAGWPESTLSALSALGHRLTVVPDPYHDFGAGQFIWRLGDPATDGYVAASDPRRDGQVAAW